MTDQTQQIVQPDERTLKLASAATFSFTTPQKSFDSLFSGLSGNQLGLWSDAIDKLDFQSHDTYENIINDCRFFFRYEPFAKIIISKMIDLAINDLIVVPDKTMSKTEISIFNAVKNDILEFLANGAMEYLITGLVVPEIGFTRVTTDFLKERDIKRTTTLMYPTDLWYRDSASIEIRTSDFSSKNSYFLIIPDKTLYFIRNEGVYSDGLEDRELYQRLLKLYPEFVKKVLDGETKILLDNPLIIAGKVLKDSPYPIPYMFSSLENMKHKRNLKKMDYSLAARVISAILHVKVGSDEFPVTEDDKEVLENVESKFKWRGNFSADDVERVFAYVTNHVTELKWIFPDINGLLDQKKYDAVNNDILISFGFPRILVTGETERSFSSDPNIATLSPIQTLEAMRKQLLKIVKRIFVELQNHNPSISTIPEVKWKPISLMSLQLFYQGLVELYKTGNISRKSYAGAFGFDINTELSSREEEQELLKELDLEPFMEVPHSNTPGQKTEKKPSTTKSKTSEVK